MEKGLSDQGVTLLPAQMGMLRRRRLYCDLQSHEPVSGNRFARQGFALSPRARAARQPSRGGNASPRPVGTCQHVASQMGRDLFFNGATILCDRRAR